MAVKVVSDKPVQTKKVVCGKCGYELEYTGEDVRDHTDCDGDSTFWINCPRPSCKHKTHVRAWDHGKGYYGDTR